VSFLRSPRFEPAVFYGAARPDTRPEIRCSDAYHPPGQPP